MPSPIDPRLLADVALFDNLTTEQAIELLPACDELDFAAGQTVFSAGQDERALYILLDGSVEIDLEAPRSGQRTVAQFGAKSVFGESSFFHGRPHSATAKTLSDAHLLRIDHDRFSQLLQANNLAALRVAANTARILATRLQQADQFIIELLDQIRDDKVHEAWARFRNSMHHTAPASGASVGVGLYR